MSYSNPGLHNSPAVTRPPILTVHTPIRDELHPRHSWPTRWIHLVPLQHCPIHRHTQQQRTDPSAQNLSRLPPSSCPGGSRTDLGLALIARQTQRRDEVLRAQRWRTTHQGREFCAAQSNTPPWHAPSPTPNNDERPLPPPHISNHAVINSHQLDAGCFSIRIFSRGINATPAIP